MTEAENLHAKLGAWLRTQGYPLEMRVAATMRSAGFNAFQSDYYTDPETKVPREVDVLAFRQVVIDDMAVRVTLAIECKSSRDKPWVLFTSSGIRLAAPASVIQRATTGLGLRLLFKVHKRPDVAQLPLFDLGERPAHGLTQGFTSGHDVTYEAIMSAAKAAAAKSGRLDATPRTDHLCDIIFPVVVLDARLFEYYLDDSGEPKLSELQVGTLVWRNPVIGMPHTIIKIYTLPSLATLSADADKTATGLLGCHAECKALAAGLKRQQSSSPR